MPFAMNNAIRIHYEIEGSGAPLVLHPGFGGSIPDWSSTGYVDALKGEYQLILIDPRGQGESDKPYEANAYERDKQVADVVAVLDNLGITRGHFLGYSMGGRVGFSMAKVAPERLRSLIIGGNDPFGRPPDHARAELLGQGMEAFLRGMESSQGPIAPEMRARWLLNDARALAAASLTDNPSLEQDLGAMGLPALIYCGDKDRPERCQRAAALMPNATFVLLPGLNHLQAFDACDMVVPRVREFLRRVSQTPETSC